VGVHDLIRLTALGIMRGGDLLKKVKVSEVVGGLS